MRDDSGSYAVFTEQRSSASQMTAFKTTGMRRTSSRRSIRLHTGQNGRCTDVIENSQIGMFRYLDTSTTTQMAEIMVQYGRHSCSSRTESVRSSFGRTVLGKAIRESSFGTRLENVPNWECFFGDREEGLFSVYGDDIKLAGKRRTLIRLEKLL